MTDSEPSSLKGEAWCGCYVRSLPCSVHSGIWMGSGQWTELGSGSKFFSHSLLSVFLPHWLSLSAPLSPSPFQLPWAVCSAKTLSPLSLWLTPLHITSACYLFLQHKVYLLYSIYHGNIYLFNVCICFILHWAQCIVSSMVPGTY